MPCLAAPSAKGAGTGCKNRKGNARVLHRAPVRNAVPAGQIHALRDGPQCLCFRIPGHEGSRHSTHAAGIGHLAAVHHIGLLRRLPAGYTLLRARGCLLGSAGRTAAASPRYYHHAAACRCPRRRASRPLGPCRSTRLFGGPGIGRNRRKGYCRGRKKRRKLHGFLYVPHISTSVKSEKRLPQPVRQSYYLRFQF